MEGFQSLLVRAIIKFQISSDKGHTKALSFEEPFDVITRTRFVSRIRLFSSFFSFCLERRDIIETD